jgi:hypothetical protein
MQSEPVSHDGDELGVDLVLVLLVVLFDEEGYQGIRFGIVLR